MDVRTTGGALHADLAGPVAADVRVEGARSTSAATSRIADAVSSGCSRPRSPAIPQQAAGGGTKHLVRERGRELAQAAVEPSWSPSRSDGPRRERAFATSDAAAADRAPRRSASMTSIFASARASPRPARRRAPRAGRARTSWRRSRPAAAARRSSARALRPSCSPWRDLRRSPWSSRASRSSARPRRRDPHRQARACRDGDERLAAAPGRRRCRAGLPKMRLMHAGR